MKTIYSVLLLFSLTNWAVAQTNQFDFRTNERIKIPINKEYSSRRDDVARRVAVSGYPEVHDAEGLLIPASDTEVTKIQNKEPGAGAAS